MGSTLYTSATAAPRTERALSREDMILEILTHWFIFSSQLCMSASKNMRAFHGSFKNHEFGMSTARVYHTGQKMHSVGVMWQTHQRPPRAVYGTVSEQGPANLTIRCSCSPNRPNYCEHLHDIPQPFRTANFGKEYI